MRTFLTAVVLAVICTLTVTGCGSGPQGVSLKELEKTTLKGLPSPIDTGRNGEFRLAVEKAMQAQGFRAVVKVLPDKTLPDGSTVSTIRSSYWNAVVLDSDSVQPELRGKVAHYFCDLITTSKKTRMGGIDRSYQEDYHWELPAKE